VSTATLRRTGRIELGSYITDCAWSGDGARLAVAGGEGPIMLITLAGSETQARTLGEHALGSLAIAWNPRTASFASSGQDGVLMLWDADAGTGRRLRHSTAWTEHLAYSADGKWLASAAGKIITLWSGSGELVRDLAPCSGNAAGLAWADAGSEIVAATPAGLVLERLSAPAARREYPAPAPCLTVAPSPNGRVLATGLADGTVRFWYRATGRVSQMAGYGAKVRLTAWSGNARYLATSSGPEIIVWDFAGKGPERSKPLEFALHTERVEALAFQPQGQWLAAAARDGRISLWLPGKLDSPADVQLAGDAPTVLRWSPNGRLLAAGERSGALTIFELTETPRPR